MSQDNAIGIFDSGLGGLTVAKEIIKALPSEDIIYFGDTARVPYGDKSPKTIIQYSIENSKFLCSKPIKLLVIACNTASAYAAKAIQDNFNIPIINVIDPAIEKAITLSKNNNIAILGTKATIASGIYPQKIKHHLPYANVTSLACPLFVPLVEENFLNHPATDLIIEEYLHPLKQKNIDTVILGCTHYPLLLPHIRKVLGDEICILDSATACAEKVKSLLEENQLENIKTNQGLIKYFASDDPEKFKRLGESFLKTQIDVVHFYAHDRQDNQTYDCDLIIS